MHERRVAASLALVGVVTTVLVACGLPEQTGLTGEQCERFADARESLEVYIADDWAAFHDGQGIFVLTGVQRAVGEIIDAAEELRSPETEDAVQAVLQAGYDHVELAGDYIDDPPLPEDPDGLAEQAEVRQAMDAALSSCD